MSNAFSIVKGVRSVEPPLKMSTRYEPALLRFDEEILRVVAMGEALQKEINGLDRQMREAGNSFSAKLVINDEITTLVRRYSEIVSSWENACKELSRWDADLEKSLQIEGDAQDIVREVKSLMEEAEASLSFKFDYEEGAPFLFEVLEPMLVRLIQAGKTLHQMVHEVLTLPTINKKSDDFLSKVMSAGLWLLPGSGFVFLIHGFLAKNQDTVLFGILLILSSFAVFLLIRWEKRAEQNAGK